MKKLSTPRGEEREARKEEAAHAETIFNTVDARSDGMDVDRAFIHAELLFLRGALRCDLSGSADSRADAGVGASLLVAVGWARAGCVFVHTPLSDRSRALV